MDNREIAKTKIRKILEDHGIQDKDKLEHIPETIVEYMREQMVEMAAAVSGDIMSRKLEFRKLKIDGF